MICLKFKRKTRGKMFVIVFMVNYNDFGGISLRLHGDLFAALGFFLVVRVKTQAIRFVDLSSKVHV